MCSPHDIEIFETHQLKRFLQQHGVNAYITSDGRLLVTDEAAVNGYPVMETVELPQTMEAVKAWLGY